MLIGCAAAEKVGMDFGYAPDYFGSELAPGLLYSVTCAVAWLPWACAILGAGGVREARLPRKGAI